jgi:hypothetical protein
MKTPVRNRVSGALHQVADSGLLEAGGLHDVDLQRMCWCLFLGMQNVVQATLKCATDRPRRHSPSMPPFQLGEAVRYVMAHMQGAIHQLARSGLLDGAGMETKEAQQFCEALHQGVHAAVHNAARLYEHC